MVGNNINGANLWRNANRYNSSTYEGNDLQCYELDEYEGQIELDRDDDYADKQHFDTEDDAISETEDGTVTKKVRVEQSVTKCRVDSILAHTGKTKFTRKYQGAAVYKSKFQLEWQRKWPCITPLREKPNYFYCTVCAKAVSCGHQGEKDVKRHMDSVLHKKSVSSVKHTQPLKVIPSNLMKKVRIMFFNILFFLTNVLFRLPGQK